MKLLYGVQGTGNGHLTRARAMSKALADTGIQVDWIFSGRVRENFTEMDSFGDFRVLRGLTLVMEHGRLCHRKTLLQNNFLQLYRDVKNLSVDGYDLIISDFEPITAWAAKLAGKKVIGISHQNAFLHDIPKIRNDLLMAWFIRTFAPVDLPIGLHWHHFNQPILPPLIESSKCASDPTPGFYLVYLPYTDIDSIISLLYQFKHCRFNVYHGVGQPHYAGNVQVLPFSRSGFQQDLRRCEGVMCHAGFALTSEAIQLGKKLLVQPVLGQVEQQSNALALCQLGLGRVTTEWTEQVIESWRSIPQPRARPYPDVASALAAWLKGGATDFDALRDALWRDAPWLPDELNPVPGGDAFDIKPA